MISADEILTLSHGQARESFSLDLRDIDRREKQRQRVGHSTRPTMPTSTGTPSP